jgi:hypothetical protein
LGERALAVYAAVVGSAALLWNVFTWWAERVVRLRVEFTWWAKTKYLVRIRNLSRERVFISRVFVATADGIPHGLYFEPEELTFPFSLEPRSSVEVVIVAQENPLWPPAEELMDVARRHGPYAVVQTADGKLRRSRVIGPGSIEWVGRVRRRPIAHAAARLRLWNYRRRDRKALNRGIVMQTRTGIVRAMEGGPQSYASLVSALQGSTYEQILARELRAMLRAGWIVALKPDAEEVARVRKQDDLHGFRYGPTEKGRQRYAEEFPGQLVR